MNRNLKCKSQITGLLNNWRFFATGVLALILFVNANAQTQTVSGRIVSDADNEPLPGVTIMIKGTSIGTVTNVDGKYNLQATTGQTLVFSFVGYAAQEIEVASSIIDVRMKESVSELDEVVVVGYGTMKKSDLSGATVSVSSEKLMSSISSGLDQALLGRAAGVSGVRTSGQPGSSVSIRIRGSSTLNADAEPLYVIDGVPVSATYGSGYDVGLGDLGGGKTTFSALATLNPSDIESLEILKDASATAIYGSRGSNGVVIITTKRGRANQTRITYDGYLGIQQQVKRLEVMNLREFAEFQNSVMSETAGRVPDVHFSDPSLLGEGTDWQSAIFQAAPMQSHQLSASGGSDKAQYAMSIGYFDQEGTLIGSKFNRLSGRLNLDAQARKWLKVGSSLMLSTATDHLGLSDQGTGVINTAVKQTPDVPVYNFDGTYAGSTGEGAISKVNPIAKALDEIHTFDRTRITGNIFADVTLYKGLVWHAEFGGDINFSEALNFFPTYDYGGLTKNDQNSVSRRDNKNTFWQLKNYLTYNFDLAAKHYFTVMVGQEASEWNASNLAGASRSLPTNSLPVVSLGDPLSMTAGSGSSSGALASFYTRWNYNFKGLYYLTFTLRADGSSNFAPGNQWGYFPAVAASWRISNENFMESIRPVMNNLKLRLGWGQNGNQNIGGFRWGSAMQKINSNLGQGYRQLNVANPGLKWETSEQINIGIDAAFLNDRISLTVDYYDKTSKDMLMQLPLPSYMGTSGNASFKMQSPYGNFGSISNRGVEISLRTVNIQRSDFRWDTDFSFTLNRNKLKDVGGIDSPLEGKINYDVDLVCLSMPGQPLYNFYGYKTNGVYRDKSDIQNSPVWYEFADDNGNVLPENLSRTDGVWPGDMKFVDTNGDGKIDINDRVFLGSPMPKFTFGLGNTFQYKGFELTVFLTGSYGNKIFNQLQRTLDNMTSLWDNQLATVNDRAMLGAVNPSLVYPYTNSTGTEVANWFDDIDNVYVTNPGTDMPRATTRNTNMNDRVSDRYIENGSYLRIQNLSLAYSFSPKLLQAIRIENLKLYVNVQNLYTFTNYSGFDPEIGQGTENLMIYGVDNARYPSPRIATVGLSVTF